MRDSSSRFIKGALIGGVVAGVAGLLLAPKPGNKLIKDILETYDCAKKNGYDFIEAIKEKGACITSCSEEEDEDNNHSSFLIGAALGAVIAGVAALLLAPDSGRKIRKLLGNQYEDIIEKAEDFVSNVGEKGKHAIDGVNEWKETLVGLISKLSNSTSKGKHQHSSKIDEIVDLAHLGIRLYQQLQSRG